ncbi:MAG: DUF2202 domain-containing protein [Candidatus Doudnabacteria bacterium]
MNKTYYYAIGVILIIGGFLAWNATHKSPMQTNQEVSKNFELLSSEDFALTFEQTPGAQMLDVRTPAEFAEGHIPTAINIDFESSDFIEQINQLDKTLTYFVYCRSGNRSAQAVQKMQAQGFEKIVELKGGIISAQELLHSEYWDTLKIDIGDEQIEQILSQVSDTQLLESEKQGLIYMREEEKLARDVYLTLYQQWSLSIFNNIASSEQTHTNAVQNLLSRFNIIDPVNNDQVGQFTNPELKNLYDQLVAQGSQSLTEGLKVGATIEDLDIADLQKYLEETKNVDIINVYQNLMKGSRNHLRSFVSQLEQNGQTYTPSYISQSYYQEIISSPKETGNSGGGGGNGKGNRQH